MSPTEIWIARRGSACGPYSKDQIDKMVQGGLVYLDDLAWSPEMNTWVGLAMLLEHGSLVAATKSAAVYQLEKSPTVDSTHPDQIPVLPVPLRRSRPHENRAADLVQLRAARRARSSEDFASSIPVSKRRVTDSIDEEVAGLIWKVPMLLAVVTAIFGFKGIFAHYPQKGVNYQEGFYHQSRTDWATSAWLIVVAVLVIVVPIAIFYAHKKLND